MIARGILTVTRKNIRIYYAKPPVVIFGLLFPAFLFLAFFLGREVEAGLFFPGFLAMTLFFTASSVGPLITPWEKQARTYERLLSYPVTLETIIVGDVLAGAIFGFSITAIVAVVGAAALPLTIAHPLLTLLGLFLGTVCFAAMGVLLASPAAQSPSNIMMLASLVRFPLIFISGIFIPLGELEGIGRLLALASPLTYLVDLLAAALHGTSPLSAGVDIVVLAMVTLLFLFASRVIHRRNMAKGLP
jgi:ABC-2 type transport system permease protein